MIKVRILDRCSAMAKHMSSFVKMLMQTATRLTVTDHVRFAKAVAISIAEQPPNQPK